MRCEPPPNAGFAGRVMELFARSRRLPTPAGSRPVNHAQQCADRELSADQEPWVELLPCPTVHPSLAALAALPMPDEHSATGAVEVALLESERFADPKPGAPEQHNQRAKPVPVVAVTDTTHHGDDLLDRRRISRILLALIARWATSVVAGHSRW